MLHGFRPPDEIAETLHGVPELHSIMPDFPERLVRAGGSTERRRDLLRDLYCTMMTMPQGRVDLLLHELTARLAAKAPSDKDGLDYWVARALETFPPHGRQRDRGIFSIYLLNLRHLQPGQGTFQSTGTLHAYLEGVTVELMASSDNVLRGGLMRKHVDIPELMRIVSFDSGLPHVLDGEPNGNAERVYRTRSDNFELSRIDLTPRGRYLGQAVRGPDSIIVIDGAATLTARGQRILLARGAIIFVPFGTHYAINAGVATAMLFKASVPGSAESLRQSKDRQETRMCRWSG